MPVTNAVLTFAAAVTLLTFDASASCSPGRVLAPQTASSSSGNTWVIFLDDLHLDFKATGHTRALFTTITKQLIQDGDLYAVVSTGPSSIAIDLTRDRAPLDGAANKFSGAALKPFEILDLPAGTDYSEVRYPGPRRARSPRIRVEETRAGAEPAQGVHLHQQRVQRRHVERLAVQTGPNPFSVKGNEFSVEHIRDELAELISQAKRSHVSVYGIDPRALSRPPRSIRGWTGTCGSDIGRRRGAVWK